MPEDLKTYKIENEEGEEIEVVNKSDLDTRQSELEELKTQNEVIQAELLKLTNKDYNFAQVKKQAKEAEEAINEKKQELDEKEKTFFQRQTEEYRNDAILTFAGEDEELKAKMLHFYDNVLNGEALTRTEINEKMRNAYKLASEGKTMNPINRAMNYNSGGANYTNKNETETSREMRKDLKISDKDVKEYGGNWTPKFN